MTLQSIKKVFQKEGFLVGRSSSHIFIKRSSMSEVEFEKALDVALKNFVWFTVGPEGLYIGEHQEN